MGVYLMASAKNGVSAHELHRDLGITYKIRVVHVPPAAPCNVHLPRR